MRPRGGEQPAVRADVTVWNRSPEKAKPLSDDGARVASTPAEAVDGADVVVTMLFDADAVTEVTRDSLPAMGDAVWAQMSTVGLEGAARLGELAEAYGVGYLDAPVLGTKQPAEDGKLVVLVSGPRDLEPRAAPVFDAVGTRTSWVGEEPGSASRLKLVVNAWVQSITVATAQSVALARDLGLDPQLFLDTIDGTAPTAATRTSRARP